MEDENEAKEKTLRLHFIAEMPCIPNEWYEQRVDTVSSSLWRVVFAPSPPHAKIILKRILFTFPIVFPYLFVCTVVFFFFSHPRNRPNSYLAYLVCERARALVAIAPCAGKLFYKFQYPQILTLIKLKFKWKLYILAVVDFSSAHGALVRSESRNEANKKKTRGEKEIYIWISLLESCSFLRRFFLSPLIIAAFCWRRLRYEKSVYSTCARIQRISTPPQQLNIKIFELI